MNQLPPGHPRTIGKYEIMAILGKGGMGIVYKARDPFIDRIVAIKTIVHKGDDEQLLARLRMEARSAGRLHHPNIVTVFDFGEDGGTTYLVMEHVEGANLARVINSGVVLPIESRVDIVIQLCDGLAYAHELGVLHRDIKPSNICLTRRGDPKILDFGLARFDETRLTKTGLTSGTVSYMSPERIRGESGMSDDVFALGAVAYEIFTYAAAFPGETYGEVVTRILSGKYPKPASQVADVPKDLDAILAKSTAVAKTERYASAADFGRALRDLKNSATMVRRVSESPSAAAEEAFKTITIQHPFVNPYTAPEMDGNETDVTAERPSAEIASYAPQTSPGTSPEPPPAVTERFSGVHFDSAAVLTHAGVAATVVAPRQRVQSVEETPTVAMSGGATAASGDVTMAPTAIKPREKPEPQAERESNVWLYVWSAVAILIVGLVPMVSAVAGVVGYIALSGVAAVAWFLAAREARPGRVSVAVIFALALLLRIVLMVQPPNLTRELYRNLWDGTVMVHGANPYTVTPSAEEVSQLRRGWPHEIPRETEPATQPPFAELVFAWWVAAGGGLLFWRILLTIADLCTVILLWDRKRPGRALGYALFPLVALEGVWLGEVTPIAAALLFGAYVLIQKRADGFAAATAVVASGFAIGSIAAIPLLFAAAWKIFWFIGAAIVTLLAPVVFFRTGSAWWGPLNDFAARSPIIGGSIGFLERLFGEYNIGNGLNGWLTLVEGRAGRSFGDINDRGLAVTLAVLALLTFITVIAQRSRDTESSLANALGIGTLLAVSLNPATWILVVPFAIAANIDGWIAVAIFSPIALLTSPAQLNWIIFGTSIVLPLAIVAITRGHRSLFSGKKDVEVPA